jgi:hypothetical protein
MGTASIHFDHVSLAWRSFWYKLGKGRASSRDCVHLQSLWRRLRGKMPEVLLDGSRCCLDACLEQVLFDAFERVRSTLKRVAVPHRIPLGLLLVSRQQLTAEQLRTALEAQRSAGHGRLGEWLLSLGFVSEDKITAALARQWSCPVLRARSSLPRISRSPQLPSTLLENFAMIPVDYVEATSTLHLAFGDGVDHNVLYAIEKMTESHTEPCMVASSFARANLQNLLRHRSEYEVTFECLADTAECCRIVRSYCTRLSASEIRLAVCGPYIWVRLFRVSRPPMDLLFRTSSPARSLSGTNSALKSGQSLSMAVVAG